LDWRKLFDWITGIVMGLYILLGIVIQVLFVVLMSMELWQQILTVLPFFISFGYSIWRLIEKGRERVKK
jgi:hypothetical protein